MVDGSAPYLENGSDEESKNLNPHLVHTFAPGKFLPPYIAPDFHIFRPSALRLLLKITSDQHRVLAFEARAGQGKTVLVSQFLSHIQADFVWLQLNEEDRDPVVFITALFTCLMQRYPKLKQSMVYQAIRHGEVIGSTAAGIVPLLIKDLQNYLKNTFYIVLDDLHLLKPADDTLSFLNTLIAYAPAQARFVLISREYVELTACRNQTCRLGNRDLAWSNNDVAVLFSQIFGIPLPADTIAKLQTQTEGWIMGLVLIAHSLAESASVKPIQQMPLLNHLMTAPPNHLNSYFSNELLDRLDRDQWHALLLLSLLDHIPLKLVQSLNVMNGGREFLDLLVQRNFFLRRLDDTPSYQFHHLFQEFLKLEAHQTISLQQRRIFLAKAGHWFLSQKREVAAMQCYLRANVYSMVDKILGNVGLYLIGTNRMTTLQDIVEKIPEKTIQSYAWISFCVAYVHASQQPKLSKPYLDRALTLFVNKNDELGEFLTLTASIGFHISVDSQLKKGHALLPRAEQLYVKQVDKLVRADCIQPIAYIALGLCYLAGQTRKAAEYSNKIASVAQERGLDDALASAVAVRGYIHMYDGDWKAMAQEIEQIPDLMQNPRVSALNKHWLFVIQYSYLSICDIPIYRHYGGLLSHFKDPKLSENTISGASILLLDTHSAMSEGRMQEAMQHVRQGLALIGTKDEEHMQSQYLAYHAYLLAIEGERDDALEAARRAGRLRKRVGGQHFEILSKILLGATYGLLNLPKKATELLDQAILESEQLGKLYTSAGAYAQRAFFRLNSGQQHAAREDIRACLKIMKNDRRLNLFSWNPVLMQTILKNAVENRIEPTYALELAHKRLHQHLTPHGQTIPILQVISLGTLQIQLNGKKRIGMNDLTNTQRDLVAILVATAPDGISLIDLQKLLWPEESQSRIRSSLDNQIARLRKRLNDHLAPYPATDYLIVEKGFVRLANMQSDAVDFLDDIRQGEEHLKNKALWQAGNAFLRAHLAYKGAYIFGASLKDAALEFRATLQIAYLNNAHRLASILAQMQSFTEAITICQQALQCDPISEPLVKTLHMLFIRSNNIVKARQVLEEYFDTLASEGFSKKELEDITQDFHSDDVFDLT